MTTRLHVTGQNWHQGCHWPPAGDPSRLPLFSGRQPYRTLVVMLDAELLESESPATPMDPVGVLAGLLSHPLVQLYRYADAGPPDSVEPDPRSRETPIYPGWAVVESFDSDSHTWGVMLPTEEGFCLSGVSGNAPDYAATDLATPVYADLDPSLAAERRRADVLASQVADQALGADIYITERPYLHVATWQVTRVTAICSPTEALAVLGLYLRSQNTFISWQDPSSHTMYKDNRGLYFWIGTRELLPAAWRWFKACVQHAAGIGNDDLMLLGGSLLQRVDRALEARDAIHIAINHPQDNDLQEQALSQLDVVLILLMSAVDVAARVAHRVLGLSSDEHFAGWQKKVWRKEVGTKHPTLAAAVDVGTRNEDTLTILRLMRNSVHGAAIQGLSILAGSGPRETLVALPTADEQELLLAMDRLGGRATWGFRQTSVGRSHVDPGVFVDRLFEGVLELLNEVMARTPVEQMAHVKLTAADSLPPPPDPADWFSAWTPWVRQSIRWQLGLLPNRSRSP